MEGYSYISNNISPTSRRLNQIAIAIAALIVRRLRLKVALSEYVLIWSRLCFFVFGDGFGILNVNRDASASSRKDIVIEWCVLRKAHAQRHGQSR